MAKTRDVTGIPLTTLWSWYQRGGWWADAERQLRLEKNGETATKIGGIVDRTLNAIVDRVESGDYVYNQRTGEISRLPVTAASLNKIATTLLDRKLTLDKMEKLVDESSEDNTAKLEKQLTKLADSFTKFVAARTRQEKVIEAEPIPET